MKKIDYKRLLEDHIHNLSKSEIDYDYGVDLVNKAMNQHIEESTFHGHTFEEAVRILGGLELERIAEMKLTMENLDIWMLKIHQEQQDIIQRQIDNSIENIRKQFGTKENPLNK